MMSVFRLLVVFLLVPVSALAQNATGTSRLEWDQPNASLSEAQGFTYAVYADGSTTPTPLTGVTCVAGTPTPVCSAPFPAFTPGSHSLSLTATNVAGESTQSAPISFTFVVVPSAPTGLRIVSTP